MSFSEFNFSPRIAAGIDALGYEQPTPIQEKAIPPVLAGRDVMGLAQTGTGKTAAFALPILQRLERGPRRKPRALIVAPTRELAEQIHQSFVALGAKTGLRSVAIYGGVGVTPQTDALRRGVEIVVACPGRLLDHVGQGNVDLSGIEVLVLDEADRMFDMGFLPDVRRIVRATPADRQTLLFSATMPDDIKKLAGEVLKNPLTVQIGQPAPAETVSHALYPVAQHLKTTLLKALLPTLGEGSVLVFTKTKHRAKRVAEQLAKDGFRATSLQGNLSQNKRQAALDGFRAGDHQIMVATDIAARGIDVLRISHVINYDMPDTPEAYTHRIGRTGRAERTGEAYTMVTSEDEADVRAVERVLGQRIERRTLPGFDYAMPKANADEFARGPRPPRPQPKQRPMEPVAQGAPRGGAQSHGQGERRPASPPPPRPRTQPQGRAPQPAGSTASRAR
ncbi:MAG: DEAD/DEAH box helicase [Anaerolineae bacterium]|nr:DEAD/DEAH box helicase [Anaerolineae bacterium]